MGEPATKSHRTAWIDVARGICIVLVVAMHFDELHFATIAGTSLAASAWDFVTSAMRPARMPAFFMISGMLASRTIQNPSKLVKRIGLLGYLYVLWAAIYLTVAHAMQVPWGPRTGGELLLAIPMQVIWPANMIWYLYALVVFMLIASAARAYPLALLLASLALYACHVQIGNDVASEMARCALFYFIGVFGKEAIAAAVRNAHPFRLILAALVYAALVLPRVFLPDVTVWLRLAASLVGVFLVFELSAILARTALKAPIGYIGRNTLPIYVMHSSFLITASYLFARFGLDLIFGASPVLIWVWPLVGIPLVLGVCLVLGSAIARMKVGGILTLPVMWRSQPLASVS